MKRSFTQNDSINSLLRGFYCVCNNVFDEFIIINLNEIHSKCVYLENKDEIFLSICSSLNEHD
jgi:hypothetical protein